MTFTKADVKRTCALPVLRRAQYISVYLITQGANRDALLSKRGKHKMGASGFHIKRLADIDLNVLEQPMRQSCLETRNPT